MDDIRQGIEDEDLSEESLDLFNPRYVASSIPAKVFSKTSFNTNVRLMNERYSVLAQKNLGSKGIKLFLQRAVRKIVRFYVEPIVEDQDVFNASTTRAMGQLYAYIERTDRRLEALKMENETLAAMVAVLESRLDENKK
jgi:hypothetical protein